MIILSHMPVVASLAARVTGLLVALLVGLGIPLSASAQLGLRGGLSLSDLAGSGVQTAEQRQGLTGGAGWTLFRLGPVEIAPELSYVQKGTGDLFLAAQQPGGGLPGTPPPNPDFVEFGLDYLEIPVLARLVLDLPVGSAGTAAYVQAGPALAWRLHCAIRPSGDGSLEVGDGCRVPQFQGADDVVRSADRGTVLGGGLLLTVGSVGQVTFNARMIRGLDRVAVDPNDPEARNRAFLFTLGWDLNGGWQGW
ncbi:MAG: hypothetical protein EA421_04285 [Gemmatimonadales bacterium]|nr:MAG: hypothetical protein EA421_04285 [Gemmatimonadales bacterium]